MTRLTTLQVAEIRRRGATGESPYAIAREVGCAYATVVRYIGCRTGVYGPRPKPPVRCDICARTAAETTIVRFALQENRGGTNRGAGAIEMCRRCWRETAAPRQRRKRAA